jgi:aspartokinase
MDNALTRIPERISVGGIKLSREQVQFSYTRPATEQCFLAPALKRIAARHINITFLSISASADHISASLCVESDHYLIVNGILKATVITPGRLECINSVGTLTVFPHRNSFVLTGRILQAFAVNKLPVYGMCTSISALSVVTDFKTLECATTALEDIVEVPLNHSPFRQELTIRQIQP